MITTPRTDGQSVVGPITSNTSWVDANFARVLECEIAELRQQVADLTAEITQIQADCDHDWKDVDDSFDHELGCEVIRFCRCEICGKTKPQEDVDDEPDYDLPKPLTPLENFERNDEHSSLL